MSKIISDTGNRKNISNKPDRSNIILNMSDNRKNILDKHNNINSIISVPRSQILIPDSKKKILPQPYINIQTVNIRSDTKLTKPSDKKQSEKSEKKISDKKQTEKPSNKSQSEKPSGENVAKSI